jgi:hypothetical protein
LEKGKLVGQKDLKLVLFALLDSNCFSMTDDLLDQWALHISRVYACILAPWELLQFLDNLCAQTYYLFSILASLQLKHDVGGLS